MSSLRVWVLAAVSIGMATGVWWVRGRGEPLPSLPELESSLLLFNVVVAIAALAFSVVLRRVLAGRATRVERRAVALLFVDGSSGDRSRRRSVSPQTNA